MYIYIYIYIYIYMHVYICKELLLTKFMPVWRPPEEQYPRN